MTGDGEGLFGKALKADARLDTLGRGTGEVILIHRVRPGSEAAVADLLESGRFDGCIRGVDGVHFLRLSVIDGGTRVLFCGGFDAPVADRLAELCIRCRVPLSELWAHCADFPAGGFEDARAAAAFVASGHQSCSYRYSAYPQSSVQQIRKALDWMRKTVRFQIELAKAPKSR